MTNDELISLMKTLAKPVTDKYDVSIAVGVDTSPSFSWNSTPKSHIYVTIVENKPDSILILPPTIDTPNQAIILITIDKEMKTEIHAKSLMNIKSGPVESKFSYLNTYDLSDPEACDDITALFESLTAAFIRNIAHVKSLDKTAQEAFQKGLSFKLTGLGAKPKKE